MLVLFWIVVAIAWIYAVVEVITTDDVLVRNMPKVVWVFVVLFFPVIGTLMWFLLGRPTTAAIRLPQPPRRPRGRPPRPPVRGPEDSEDFLRRIEEERRRREDGVD